MAEQEWLTERFEENRARLRAVAYRMLGSLSEAEDAVQEAWLRLSRADANAIQNLSGWLTTSVARVCLDMLRSRKSRREEPLETYVPDPVVSREDRADPENQALLADAVGLALLVVLETLAPAERLHQRARGLVVLRLLTPSPGWNPFLVDHVGVAPFGLLVPEEAQCLGIVHRRTGQEVGHARRDQVVVPVRLLRRVAPAG